MNGLRLKKENVMNRLTYHFKAILVLVVTSLIFPYAFTAFGSDAGSHQMLMKASCEDCHLKDSHVVIPTTDQCLSCHNSYSELAKKTENVEDIKKGISNPHKSHIGEARCTLCHKIHSPSVLYCNTCHSPQFHLKVP